MSDATQGWRSVRLTISALSGRLARDRRGVSIVEFALTLPLLIAAGGYGIELSNLALSHLRVSQYALNLADNASRVGAMGAAGVTTMRESDVNDIFQGVREQSEALALTTHGRVTLSSLERVRQPFDDAERPAVQRIHWQRCVGLKSGAGYDSSYGSATVSDGSTDTSAHKGIALPNGMGEADAKVNAPDGSGLMFVEINYDYQRLFGTMFVGDTKIKYIASFIVRDNRNFTKMFNPATPKEAPKATCNLYVA